MSKILVTGASGFIGSHLVDSLLETGVKEKDLRLFVLKGESLKNLPSKNFDIIFGDIRKPADVKKAVKDVDVIYHLAAVTRDGEGKYLSVNWGGTKNLLRYCKNIKKLIFFSTIAVFGLPAFVGDKENINEESEKIVAGEYAQSKYLAEKELLKAHKKYGFSYKIVRPTTVFGPRDKAGVYQLLRSIKNHYYVNIGDGKNKVDYVYVKDLVKGARLAQLSKSKTGDFILGADKPITFRQLAKVAAKSLNKKIPDWYIPKQIAILLAYMLEKLNELFGINLPLSMDRVRVMTSSYYFDSSHAKIEIGYLPNTPLTKAMKATANYLDK